MPTNQTSYETIHVVVNTLERPFKRANIMASLERQGLVFTEAAVAGWINRARVKGDIVSAGDPGSYTIGDGRVEPSPGKPAAVTSNRELPRGLSILEAVEYAPPPAPIERQDYTPADLENLRRIVREKQRGGFEFVGGLGVLGSKN